YVFSEFLSPGWNFRDDEYGGAVENRARLLCDGIRARKERGGRGVPGWGRLHAPQDGGAPGAATEAPARPPPRPPGGGRPARPPAELAEEAGADAIHVSAYAPDTMGHHFTDAPLPHAPGAYVDFAAAIKARVRVPVIAVGRIEPEVADRLIRDGRADLVSMGRKMLADPEIARKLALGRADAVRPCVYCYTCVAQAFFDRPVRCAVNPEAGKEAERTPLVRTPAARRRKVLVAGGGPAGMEAARVATARGHEVVLCEASARLGGTLRLAALVYEPNERLLRWFEARMKELPLALRMEQEVTPALVREIAPDVVIAAVGASHARPQIAGAELPHVFDADDLRALLTGQGAAAAGGKLSALGRLAVRAGRLAGLTDDPARLREASRAYMPIGRRVVVIGPPPL